jgi:hypothetical protein
MAGSIKWQEGAAQTIGTTAAVLATGSGVLLGQIDARAVAAGAMADAFSAIFTLAATWATVTGIAANTTIADLYLVPSIDGGVTFPDVDLTAGASVIAYPHRWNSPFVASKAPTASTPMNFATLPGDLFPAVYSVYLINRSGQTMSVGAVVKGQAFAVQYT